MPRLDRRVGDRRTGATPGFVGRLLDVRRGEWILVILLAIAAFAIICAYYFLKPASKSIFLAAFGSRSVPDAYIAVALVTAVVGTIYAKLSRRVTLVPLLNGVMLLLAGLIVAFRFGLETTVTGWLAWAFYIFVGTFGVLAPAMLWFAINHMLDARQARRLLGYIGTGAICGGIVAGYTVKFMLRHVSEADLLWGAEGFFVLALVALNIALFRTKGAGRERVGSQVETSGTFRLIVSHPYVRMLTLLISVIMVCASMAEYQFLWAVGEFVAPGKETTGYIALWYSNINLACLPIQLLVTAPLLRRFGVGPALLVLPAALVAIATGMAAAPILAFGTAMKVGEGTLRYSVNKSAIELLYLPVPRWIKDRSKVFIDTVVDRSAKGAAGVILKGLQFMGLGIQVVSLVTACLALMWIALSLVMRRRNVSAFREALARGVVDLDAERIHLEDPAAFGVLEASLRTGTPDVVRHALDVLLNEPDINVERLDEVLSSLALSPDPGIAWRALTAGARTPSDRMLAAARIRLGDDDPLVAAAATEALLVHDPSTPAEFIAEVVRLTGGREAQAVSALFASGHDVEGDVIERLLDDPSPHAVNARRVLAITLSRGHLPHRRHLIRRLMVDPQTDVAAAALSGAGSLQDAALVPFLLNELKRPGRRSAAREGLVRMGRSILQDLDGHMRDRGMAIEIRTRIPRVVASIGGFDAHHFLRRALVVEEPPLRHEVLRALNTMARTGPGFPVPDAIVEASLVAECQYLARLLALVAEPGEGGPRRRLFERAVTDSVRQGRDRTFRVLGLRGRGRDWADAFAGLIGDDARLRASAVEFADGTLPDHLRRIVVPLIDDIGPAEAVHRVAHFLDVERLTRARAYDVAARGSEPWLTACAFFAATEEGIDSVLEAARERHADPDAWVCEAASGVLVRLDAGAIGWETEAVS